jgi:hypothetical protein
MLEMAEWVSIPFFSKLLVPLDSHSLRRRDCVLLLLGGLAFGKQVKDAQPGDWRCPMDPDIRESKPGVCPRCGMTLVLHVPDRVEYSLEVSQSPAALRPGDSATLTFRALDPVSGRQATKFEIVHEKLIHLFLVNENLEFFAHIHPVIQPDGSFKVSVTLPFSGMYRMLADYYPSGSVPQLSLDTVYVSGPPQPAHLDVSLAPCKSVNLTASLRMDPEAPIAGLETKLFFTLDPAEGLEKYLGAWGHMLAASEDLIDLLHLHPFLANGGSVQFNIIFPRAGLYKIWTQFQREGEVNTVVFTVPVKSL